MRRGVCVFYYYCAMRLKLELLIQIYAGSGFLNAKVRTHALASDGCSPCETPFRCACAIALCAPASREFFFVVQGGCGIGDLRGNFM